jgi:hypothetical protein
MNNGPSPSLLQRRRGRDPAGGDGRAPAAAPREPGLEEGGEAGAEGDDLHDTREMR